MNPKGPGVHELDSCGPIHLRPEAHTALKDMRGPQLAQQDAGAIGRLITWFENAANAAEAGGNAVSATGSLTAPKFARDWQLVSWSPEDEDGRAGLLVGVQRKEFVPGPHRFWFVLCVAADGRRYVDKLGIGRPPLSTQQRALEVGQGSGASNPESTTWTMIGGGPAQLIVLTVDSRIYLIGVRGSRAHLYDLGTRSIDDSLARLATWVTRGEPSALVDKALAVIRDLPPTKG